jgi:hypothetical protein
MPLSNNVFSFYALSVFSLQKLVEVADGNMFLRSRIEWSGRCHIIIGVVCVCIQYMVYNCVYYCDTCYIRSGR